ncbi:MAG TPA: efflux RND transporter periplasmic adaptor subunit, partial [Polyangiales bacterium]
TYPGHVFTGKVSYINASIDTDTRTAKVRIEVPNPERLLRPGQFVHARIALRGSPEPVISVPRKAVLQVEGDTSVFVQTGKETYVVRPVELGHVAGDVIEIRRGLIEGESIVTEGGFVLKSELQR